MEFPDMRAHAEQEAQRLLMVARRDWPRFREIEGRIAHHMRTTDANLHAAYLIAWLEAVRGVQPEDEEVSTLERWYQL